MVRLQAAVFACLGRAEPEVRRRGAQRFHGLDATAARNAASVPSSWAWPLSTHATRGYRQPHADDGGGNVALGAKPARPEVAALPHQGWREGTDGVGDQALLDLSQERRGLARSDLSPDRGAKRSGPG